MADTAHPEHCSICSHRVAKGDSRSFESIRPGINALIRNDIPNWGEDSRICHRDYRKYRRKYLENELRTENNHIGRLEESVLQSVENGELLSAASYRADEAQDTFGQRIADQVARFGGSWTFIILFFVVLISWMAINALVLINDAFDPFPFILLNLMLSSLAAFQAPIIMMSQNRKDEKDRKRGDHNYIVDLKAELEIRQLHEKLDLQWESMAELQNTLLDFIEDYEEDIREMTEKTKAKKVAK